MSNIPSDVVVEAIHFELHHFADRFRAGVEPGEGLKWLRAVRGRARTMEAALVTAMLDAGGTWRSVAAGLGVGPSVAHRTYARRVEEYREYRGRHPDGPQLVPGVVSQRPAELQEAYEAGYHQEYDHDAFGLLDRFGWLVDDAPSSADGAERVAAMLDGAAAALRDLASQRRQDLPTLRALDQGTMTA